MFLKFIKFLVFIIIIMYQSALYSQSISSNKFNSKNFSKYFSGIIAFENQNNSDALKFFNSSKILLNKHDPYLKKYISSLVLENKISRAINLIKSNKEKKNINFFDAYFLLFIDSLKRGDFNNADKSLRKAFEYVKKDEINLAILETLKQYIHVFKEKEFLKDEKNFGNLSLIAKTFQKCFLNDPKTDSHFVNLVEKVDEDNSIKFNNVFSCQNPNDIISEFLFLISNLYSSYDNLEKSNFYLNLSNFLNPKFIFNLSLVAENYYLNNNFEKAKKILKVFKKEDNFYYWYRVKIEAKIIAKKKNLNQSLNYVVSKFNEINNPDDKMIFDLANFYKNSKEYELSIKHYTNILKNLEDESILKSDLLYRRGGSYERMGNYKKADEDLLKSLKINPDEPYVLNYLAYSWLERDYKINEAIKMLENAYSEEKNDPYIIDSIGWGYFLLNDYLKAEKFLRRALELMPEDPIVNDHYGDILWKLDRKIEARYFWNNVLKMDDAEKEMIDNINIKIVDGLKKS